ncbi:Nardilysin [Cyphomyrmex costatus]|uniref:Nardilysin n=1 Tax=Cyphomyrmex costatus TaxID=456900 RepID=A0A195CCT9_9HYME|nr:Nardilysin [Cyphomyrmex costatus]
MYTLTFFKQAACGLCINVGRLSDPKICPGITRFLEASLFRQLDEHILNNINLEDFISSNNGTKDVSIDSEHTTFYFEIDNKALVRALDCFAQFFIKPMITKSSLEMQQETIRNEFQMALFNGNLRYEQLFSSFAQIGHPVHKISSDNIIKMRNELDSENLHNVLLKFKERHYSAHRMKLVIQSRLSLDALEEFVIKFFANIPTNKLHPENFMRFKDVLPFDTPAFRKMYKVHDSMESLTQLKITWALPLLHDFNYYKYKPDQYISWIIEYKGKGSLINYLRKKKWCPTYNMFHCNYERNSLYSSIQLTMKLTHEGRKHLEDVLNAIFSFINLLKKEGPQKEIYNDILQSKHNYFRFKDYKKEPISHVKKLCKNMHIYPSESYLTGELHFDFNSELIQESLNNLVPEMTNIMIFSKNIDLLELDQFDPCWMTEYKDIEIPKKWIKHWKVIEPLPEIFLPLPNIFLTREFSVIPLPKKVPKYPIKLYSDPVSEIWYCPDSKFRTPKCYVCFHFITPLKLQSVKNGVLMGMYCDVLKELITEELYPAEQAGFKYNIDVGEIGFTLQISGFRPTMPLLLNLLASNMVKLPEYITEDLFQSIKTQQIELYNIGIKKPEILIKDMLLSILKLVHYSQVDMLTALHNITLKDFEEFVISFTDYLYIQCLVQGNVIQIDAFNLVQQFIKTINPMPLHSSATQYLRSIQIPLGTSYYKIKNVNKLDATSLVLNHYQVGIKSIESFMLIKLLMVSITLK